MHSITRHKGESHSIVISALAESGKKSEKICRAKEVATESHYLYELCTKYALQLKN